VKYCSYSSGMHEYEDELARTEERGSKFASVPNEHSAARAFPPSRVQKELRCFEENPCLLRQKLVAFSFQKHFRCAIVVVKALRYRPEGRGFETR
jgi:hypothetical protein